MFFIIPIVVIFILILYYKRFQRKQAIWIYANRIAFAFKYEYKNTGSFTKDDANTWKKLLNSLPKNVSNKLPSTPKQKLLVKYLVIKKMFDNGNMAKLTPSYISDNYKLFLECAFIKESLVGRRLRDTEISTIDDARLFVSALDQISQAVDSNFPNL